MTLRISCEQGSWVLLQTRIPDCRCDLTQELPEIMRRRRIVRKGGRPRSSHAVSRIQLIQIIKEGYYCALDIHHSLIFNFLLKASLITDDNFLV